MNNSHDNDQVQQMGDQLFSITSSHAMNNPQLQPSHSSSLSMTSFPGLGIGLGDHHLNGPRATPPPPHFQIVNPFIGSQPLVSHERIQQATTGGPTLQQLEIQPFNQDIRHPGYLEILNLPPPFQLHPNLQSHISTFQHDMGQNGQRAPQSFIPSEIVSIPQEDRSSHFLQPHVRQRARRRSRANRVAIQQAMHEANVAYPPQSSILGRPRDTSSTNQDHVMMNTNFGGSGGNVAQDRLEGEKCKGLEENQASIGENFECNICFQKANEAVVTCCGHLFCWPCLYRWLHIHSYHKECPVCKGAIDESNVTPIYGRDWSNFLSTSSILGESMGERIPPRPRAHRIESARQLREWEDRGHEQDLQERTFERDPEQGRELTVSNDLVEAASRA